VAAASAAVTAPNRNVAQGPTAHHSRPPSALAAKLARPIDVSKKPIAEARSLYRKAADFAYLDPVGVSVHIGSQITDVKPFGETMERHCASSLSICSLSFAHWATPGAFTTSSPKMRLACSWKGRAAAHRFALISRRANRMQAIATSRWQSASALPPW